MLVEGELLGGVGLIEEGGEMFNSKRDVFCGG